MQLGCGHTLVWPKVFLDPTLLLERPKRRVTETEERRACRKQRAGC